MSGLTPGVGLDIFFVIEATICLLLGAWLSQQFYCKICKCCGDSGSGRGDNAVEISDKMSMAATVGFSSFGLSLIGFWIAGISALILGSLHISFQLFSLFYGIGVFVVITVFIFRFEMIVQFSGDSGKEKTKLS